MMEKLALVVIEIPVIRVVVVVGSRGPPYAV